MKDLFTKNLLLKFLSVVSAFLLWLIVLNINDPVDYQTFYNVPVELTNQESLLNEGKVYEVLDNTGLITVKVSAKRSVLNTLTKDNIRATADLREISVSNTVGIKLSTNKSISEIESISSTTEFLKLNVESVLKKQLVIDVVTTGYPDDGYMIGDVRTDQNLVRLAGPESVISEIVMAQAVVDVSGMSENISTTSELKYFDSEGNQIISDAITANINLVDVNVSLLTTKKVPIQYSVYGEPASGYGLNDVNLVTPAEIEIKGHKSALNGIEFVVIPDGVIDITDAVETKEFRVNIESYLPGGVSLQSESDKTVVVSIGVEKIDTRTLEIPEKNMSLLNIPEEFTGKLLEYDKNDELIISGITSVLKEQDPDHYKGTIDVGGFFKNSDTEPAEGVYLIEVKYLIPDKIGQVQGHYVIVYLEKKNSGENPDEIDINVTQNDT